MPKKAIEKHIPKLAATAALAAATLLAGAAPALAEAPTPAPSGGLRPGPGTGAVKPSTPTASGRNDIVVHQGDTLYGLAMRYRTTVRDFQQLNGMGASTRLRTGRMLHVPEAVAGSQPGTAQGTVHAATDANFAQVVLRSDKTVLVSYWAEWCNSCRELNPVLQQVAAEHPEVRVVRLNIDDSPASAAAADVTSVPTLKVYQSGTVVKTMAGVRSKAAIEQGLTNLVNHKP